MMVHEADSMQRAAVGGGEGLGDVSSATVQYVDVAILAYCHHIPLQGVCWGAGAWVIGSGKDG